MTTVFRFYNNSKREMVDLFTDDSGQYPGEQGIEHIRNHYAASGFPALAQADYTTSHEGEGENKKRIVTFGKTIGKLG